MIGAWRWHTAGISIIPSTYLPCGTSKVFCTFWIVGTCLCVTTGTCSGGTGHIDDLFDDTLRDALLGHLHNFIHSWRHKNVDDLLHSALLNPLLWNVLGLSDVHGLRQCLDRGTLLSRPNKQLDDLVDVLSLRHLSCFNHNLNGGNKTLYYDGNIQNERHLWDLGRPLHLLEQRHLLLRHNGHYHSMETLTLMNLHHLLFCLDGTWHCLATGTSTVLSMY